MTGALAKALAFARQGSVSLAEIRAVGFTGKQMDGLRDSMNLDSNQIHELLDRAEETFEAAKMQLDHVEETCISCNRTLGGIETIEVLQLARSVIRDMARGWLENDLVVSPKELVDRIGAARKLAAWSVTLPKQLGDDYAKHRSASSAFRYDFEDPIKACVREALCNARDAHREVGKRRLDAPPASSVPLPPDKPVRVILPTELARQIEIKDEGPAGISPRRMGDIFLNYGASTKRRDKAPMALTMLRTEGDPR